MGPIINDPPHFHPPDRGGAQRAPWPVWAVPLLRIFSLVRYRFFLFAGLLPYLLGAAWGFGMEGIFRPGVFWAGFVGIFLSVVGVEAFNEYFDSRMGTDRVFNPNDEPPISDGVLWLGLAAFAAAAVMGLGLARGAGWPVLLYAGLGGLAAAFYVGPPIRWVYRGLGETMIALSYGPWMTLGSLHLQTHRFSWGGLLASLVPACLIAALAVVNEIPDFHQDRLVGKRNLVVRFGRRAGVRIYLGLAAVGLAVPVVGVVLGLFPWTTLGILAAAPLLVKSGRAAVGTYETPLEFVPAVRSIVLCYVLGTVLFSLALAFEGLR